MDQDKLKKTNENTLKSEKTEHKKETYYQKKFKHWKKVLTDEQYLSEMTYGRLSKKIINTIRIAIVASKKFIQDDCFTEASAIAYTTLVSLIPTLTVGLTFYSIFSGVGDKKSELFREITKFMSEHNLQRLNMDPVLDAISGLVDNAASIGGVGAIITVFSATALLRTLEKSLNRIWRVEKQRTFMMKIIYYWAALSLGPILVISGTTLAAQISNAFTSPDYKAITTGPNNKVWVTGTKGAIRYRDVKSKQYTAITSENIDFDNQIIYDYNRATNSFETVETPVDPIEFPKFAFAGIQFIGEKGIIAGKNGIILISETGGKSWSLQKAGSFNFTSVKMLSSDRIFITAEGGYLLKSIDGGKNWTLKSWPEVTGNLNAIEFSGTNGIVACDKGFILKSNDSGENWLPLQLESARVKKKYENLNDIQFFGENTSYIAGDEGIILVSEDKGNSWIQKRFKNYSYSSVLVVDQNTRYAAGEKGVLLSTSDNGKRWDRRTLPADKIKKLFYTDKTVVAIGNTGLFMYYDQASNKWKGATGTNFFVNFLSFVTPFFFVWVLFLIIYIALPNTKIPFKPAAIGASLTSAIWVAFVFGFIIYIKAFANGTFAVYGALAAIPLFLLMIYTSTLIVLYGAEVSYTLMHPELYHKMRTKIKEKELRNYFNGIKLAHFIYRKFETGEGESTDRELHKAFLDSYEEIRHIIDIYKQENIIIERNGNYLPANSSRNIKIADLLEMVSDSSYEIHQSHEDALKKQMKALFEKLNKSKKSIIGEMTLADLI